MSKKAKMNKRKILIIAIVSFIVSIPLIIMPVSTVAVYESIFCRRYETESWKQFSPEDFEGLQMERSDFECDGVRLAGYKYSKDGQDEKGVVVIAHGLGGGGHNAYMPFVDQFTSNGYYVFAYDAIGNDNSEGRSQRGLPEGIICLDSALDHAATVEEYKNLPFTLFGHSWGGYSVGNVLNLHPEIRAAVIVAGFNESEDMLGHYGEKYGGAGSLAAMPYLKLYERIKFGKEYTDISAVQGFRNTDAGIMIVHSTDDATVPVECGYDIFYEEFADLERFEFVLYENRGHTYLLYSQAAFEYKEQLNADYKAYVEGNGKKYNDRTKEQFMNAYLDKKQCFEPDPVLVERIIEMFDGYCSK